MPLHHLNNERHFSNPLAAGNVAKLRRSRRYQSIAIVPFNQLIKSMAGIQRPEELLVREVDNCRLIASFAVCLLASKNRHLIIVYQETKLRFSHDGRRTHSVKIGLVLIKETL